MRLISPPPWLVVVNVMLGTVTVSLNNSALNPAIPAFIAAFDLGPVLASWIMAAFMASMGMTMPLTGYLSQRLGRKTLYLSGLALFVAGSLLGALAQSIEAVLAARVIQGMASGLMIPLSLAIIFSVYPKERRGRVTGLWGAAVMLAPAVGPLCGSLVLEFYRWPALFLINVPVGLLGLVLGLKVLPASEPPKKQPFDLLAYLLIASGIGLLLVTIGRLQTLASLMNPVNQGMLLAAFSCLGGFVWLTLRRRFPLLNLRLFNQSAYRSSVVIAVVQAVGMFESLLLAPLLIQLVMGYSAIWTGLVLLATAVFASLFGQIGGRQLDRKGPQGTVSLGLLLTGLATMGLGLITPDTAIVWVFVLMAVRGAGIGLSYMPVTTAGINALPENMVTEGAVMNNISRRLCASLALVLASLWLEFRLGGGGFNHPEQYASAISDVFLATGGLVLIALPWALNFGGESVAESTAAEPS